MSCVSIPFLIPIKEQDENKVKDQSVFTIAFFSQKGHASHRSDHELFPTV
jgi:hypothetical protein